MGIGASAATKKRKGNAARRPPSLSRSGLWLLRQFGSTVYAFREMTTNAKMNTRQPIENAVFLLGVHGPVILLVTMNAPKAKSPNVMNIAT